MPTRYVSVACRAIPNKTGEGATGCGAGWTQPATDPPTCPKCHREVYVTGTYWVIPLHPQTPVNKAKSPARPADSLVGTPSPRRENPPWTQ